MESWWYLLIIVSFGVPLLGLATWADWRSKHRHHKVLNTAPSISGEDGELPAPGYLAADEVLNQNLELVIFEADRSAELLQQLSQATQIPAGWADPRFATHDEPLRTVFWNPVVIVCDSVGSFRELLTPLRRIRLLGCPLVVIAEEFHPDVIATLVANRLQMDLEVLAVAANKDIRDTVVQGIGSLPCSRADLQAGYLPAKAMPRIQLWVTDPSTSWFNPKP